MDPIKKKYVILRLEGTQSIGSSNAKEAMVKGLNSTSAFDKLRLSVNYDEINLKDKEMIEKDKSVVSVVQSMPMRLIQPFCDNRPSDISSEAWGVSAVGANASPYKGSGIKVAVLDTGIKSDHDAFANVDIETKNFTDEIDEDINGHGTHCAGTLFGSPVNKKAIGIAPNIDKAFIGKVLGKNGGSTESILGAINWAVESGANVISMSLGIDFPGYVKNLEKSGYPIEAATSIALEGYRENLNLYRTLVDYINQRGKYISPCLIVAASGNESRRPNYEISTSPPAVVQGVISVGAIDKNYEPAYFSNTHPDICAPGVDVLSASLSGGLTEMSGTSMATPHVAGIATLWAEKLKNENLFNSGIFRTNLLSCVDSTILTDYDTKLFGRGLVKAPKD